MSADSPNRFGEFPPTCYSVIARVQDDDERARRLAANALIEAYCARFRTYLRTCVDGFVANARTAASRHKRGGGAPHVPLDFTTAEGELRGIGLPVAGDPESIFRDEWVRRMFELAVDDLREYCRDSDKNVQFSIFERYDLEPPESRGRRITYEDMAREFGLPVGPDGKPGIDGGLMPRQRPGQGPIVVAGVDSIDASSAKITKAGGTPALPKMAIPGVGWAAYFIDTEGNVFGIFQDDPNAS